jgi:hypothetical protein
MKNKIILLTFLFVFISCNYKSKDFIEIYFFEDNYFTTDIPINCNNFDKTKGLLKLKITSDDTLYTSLVDIDKYINFKQYSQGDYRYKLRIKKDIYCIANTGVFVLNNKITGKISLLGDIRKFIDENIENAIEVTEPLEKPSLPKTN